MVKACKGKSNKIAIVQGAPTAAASAYTLKGVENVLAKHPEIKVVSNQAADWDAAKAKAITQTVLKQNPDLCGIVGFWDGMDIGTAAAIKEAGLTGKVFLATSGGGEQKGACDLVKSGAFDLDISYDVPTQAQQHGGDDQVAAAVGHQARRRQGIDLHDADPDHQGQRRQRGPAGSWPPKKLSVVDRDAAPGRRTAPRRRSAICTVRADPMRETLICAALPLLARPLLGEILSKRWTETAIPVLSCWSSRSRFRPAIADFLSPASLADTARQAGEIGFVVLGMALVMIVGGIDLSVGSIFALTNFCALYLLHVLKWPVPAVVVATLACGALLGAVNGFLVGYLRLRAFLTTLITLIIYRSVYDMLILRLLHRDRRQPFPTPRLGLHRRRRPLRHADVALRLRRGRDLRPRLPDAAAAGLAHHGDRRLAPLGLQCRHRGAPHGRAAAMSPAAR